MPCSYCCVQDGAIPWQDQSLCVECFLPYWANVRVFVESALQFNSKSLDFLEAAGWVFSRETLQGPLPALTEDFLRAMGMAALLGFADGQSHQSTGKDLLYRLLARNGGVASVTTEELDAVLSAAFSRGPDA